MLMSLESSRHASPLAVPVAAASLPRGWLLVVRDRKEVRVAFQLLIYPMIDHRNATPASYAITDPRVWNRESNRLGW